MSTTVTASVAHWRNVTPKMQQHTGTLHEISFWHLQTHLSLKIILRVNGIRRRSTLRNGVRDRAQGHVQPFHPRELLPEFGQALLQAVLWKEHSSARTDPHGWPGSVSESHRGLLLGAAGTYPNPQCRAPEPARPRPRGTAAPPAPRTRRWGRGPALSWSRIPRSPCHCAASAAPPAPRWAPASARPSRRPPGAVGEFGQSAPPAAGGPSPAASPPRPRAHLRVWERRILRVRAGVREGPAPRHRCRHRCRHRRFRPRAPPLPGPRGPRAVTRATATAAAAAWRGRTCCPWPCSAAGRGWPAVSASWRSRWCCTPRAQAACGCTSSTSGTTSSQVAPTPVPTLSPVPVPTPARPDRSAPRRHEEEPGRAGAGRQPQPAVPGGVGGGGRAAGAGGLWADGGAGAAAEGAGRRRAAGAADGVPGLLPRQPVPGGRHGSPRGAPRLLALGEAAAGGDRPHPGRGRRPLPGNGSSSACFQNFQTRAVPACLARY